MEAFKKKFPERPDPQDWAPMSYSAMMLVLDAIKSVGTEPDALIKSLAAAETDSPFGKLKFVASRNGVHQLLTKLSIVQYQNGKKVIVYPGELAGASKVQYPVPAWKDR
jgi:ABC-type branched-subunit amino acid transport system substrate-binding protein